MKGMPSPMCRRSRTVRAADTGGSTAHTDRPAGADLVAGWPGVRSRPRLAGRIAAVTMAAALTGGLVACTGGGSASPPPVHASTAAPLAGTVRRVAPAGGGVTLLAALDATAGEFARPGGPRSGWVPGSWHGARSVLPIISSRPGWVRVRLAQRPNGSTAWIRDSSFQRRITPYRIVVNLATTHLALYDDGRKVFSTPAGVGTASDPTPAGQYFVAFFEAPPASAYGAFVIVTSAHSDAISDWQGSGDAVIAIHGPLGSGQLIGTKGARLSHGCVRLPEAALLRLRLVPAGTPIEIIR